MRKKIVAGNWKMNKTLQEGIELAKEVNTKVKALNASEVKVIIGTPFIHLAEVTKTVEPTVVSVAAQNCATEASGAFTGEISAAMVASTGSQYVILGHSERRSYYGETDEILVKKVARALENKLEVIFCVGEVLAERESEKHFDVVKSQLVNGLFNLSAEEFSHIIIAYEPVWAIGTGKTATSAQAQEMHAFIRKVVAEKYGKEVADNTSILYGGSCNAKNADELFANEDVDGGLIGGASLKAEDFSIIVAARAKH
ncbi:MAG: triose-phosphate isomerase [Odoribacter sp.]|nr:triose-phosphate isomerase [Odoribacter sp.]